MATQVIDRSRQFAVGREDPSLEWQVIQEARAERVFLLGGAGCTALSLQALGPHLRLSLVEPNPAQRALVEAKAHAVRNTRGTERDWTFNIGCTGSDGLNASGNFEALCRRLNAFISDFVIPLPDLYQALHDAQEKATLLPQVFGHKYWSVAFELFFSDTMLHPMFGPDATRYVMPGFYPRHFREAYERGLSSLGATSNPFLHVLLFGCYDRATLPTYLSLPAPTAYHFEWLECPVGEVRDFSAWDVVSLSNVSDWMPPATVTSLVNSLSQTMAPGSYVIFRQLNQSSHLEELLASNFTLLGDWAKQALVTDRSLLYAKFIIARKK